MELNWASPSLIRECIIDLNPDFIPNLKQVFNSLDNLCCTALEIRIYNEIAFSDIEKVLRLADGLTITSINLIKKCNVSIILENVISLCDQNNRVTQVTVFNADEDSLYQSKELLTPIRYTSKSVANEKHCGIIHADFFSVNLDTFTEAINHNTCLNRKIAIDSAGNIKNCPSMTQSFGNIRDTTLEEALGKPGFKKFWNINKDQITKCQDCEFRYVCTDCRAYTDNVEDPYSAPLKCGYDPYSCTWEDWSTHPMKQQAIDHYGIRDIL
ncbi:grasp-with-spasm system SPASM domain peptide maturase [Niabella defluvii]|nr:grasp-with-spasm system SPASM domain peptide maturase [Niabella sp. I65]